MERKKLHEDLFKMVLHKTPIKHDNAQILPEFRIKVLILLNNLGSVAGPFMASVDEFTVSRYCTSDLIKYPKVKSWQ